jgi:hypothetical protein
MAAAVNKNFTYISAAAIIHTPITRSAQAGVLWPILAIWR